MHRVEPHRTKGLDIYSTTLWHLQKDIEMSFLAQEVTDFEKTSSEAWCVVGNCFSLQKEPELALKFFQRVCSQILNHPIFFSSNIIPSKLSDRHYN